jgi:hypothetical protein
VYRGLAMRIVNAGKSKYYAALSNFERARKCYLKAGLGDAWQVIAQNVRHRHQNYSPDSIGSRPARPSPQNRRYWNGPGAGGPS